MKLQFDAAKDLANIAKHYLSLADAMLVYNAPFKVTVQALRNEEVRQIDIALVEVIDVVLVLIYVIRGDTLRAISLRRASKAERRFYHEQVKD